MVSGSSSKQQEKARERIRMFERARDGAVRITCTIIRTERRIQHGSRAANKRHALEKSGHHWNVRLLESGERTQLYEVGEPQATDSWWCKRTFSGTRSTPAIAERTSAWAQIKCWFFLLNYFGSLFIGACFVPSKARRVNTKSPMEWGRMRRTELFDEMILSRRRVLFAV